MIRYPNIREARFIRRPNRFVAEVELDGEVTVVHVKNTGRCRELLLPGARVWLTRSDNASRRTAYDLVAVEKQVGCDKILINMDSAMPNDAAEEWLAGGGLGFQPDSIRREVREGNSRFDFCIEADGRLTYVEVKGVTLERDGVAAFPDAPTERGVKHVRELCALGRRGIGAAILFVVQMRPVGMMRPNYDTHPEFGEALLSARDAGVEIIAVDSLVTEWGLEIGERIPVKLERE